MNVHVVTLCGLDFCCFQPCLRQLAWPDPEVRADVLQAVLPQQRQGHWLHQGIRASTLLARFLNTMPEFDIG
jgi:hypothetical protein